MQKIYQLVAAAIGAIMGFVTGVPAIMWVMVGVMTLDYITGLICGAIGKSPKTDTGGLSSRTAFIGLMRKCMIILVVLLAVLLDAAVASEAGVSFGAVTGATCMWFIASEGVSVLENAAEIGLPIPGVLRGALDIMRGKGEGTAHSEAEGEVDADAGEDEV